MEAKVVAIFFAGMVGGLLLGALMLLLFLEILRRTDGGKLKPFDVMGREASGSQAQIQQELDRILRILFVTANPDPELPVDIDEEVRTLRNELKMVKFRDRIALHSYHAIRPDDLVRYVREESPVVVHFSGHASEHGIALRSDVDKYHVASGENLRQLFEDRGVQLVVLNACYTKQHAMEISQSVPSVVGTSSAITDEAARHFSCAFYRAIGNGLTIRDALRDGVDAASFYSSGDSYQKFGNVNRRLIG
ncbi:CHAT domain-containing protein [Sorangium sp. So ce291]|uniref:CHAT domain-containing protein n=1 Tax=Sorangium sp. So ce291 TaxID=3133294 RepID=UPI003F63BB60